MRPPFILAAGILLAGCCKALPEQNGSGPSASAAAAPTMGAVEARPAGSGAASASASPASSSASAAAPKKKKLVFPTFDSPSKAPVAANPPSSQAAPPSGSTATSCEHVCWAVCQRVQACFKQDCTSNCSTQCEGKVDEPGTDVTACVAQIRTLSCQDVIKLGKEDLSVLKGQCDD